MSLVPLDSKNRGWFENAYDAYIEELVSMGGVYRRDEKGVWQPDYLGYWIDTTRPVLQYLVSIGDVFSGFALMGAPGFPYKNSEHDYKLCEFTVTRAFRGQGIGRRAVEMLWQQHPGKWEIEVLHANQGALAFWGLLLKENPTLKTHERALDMRFEFEV